MNPNVFAQRAGFATPVSGAMPVGGRIMLPMQPQGGQFPAPMPVQGGGMGFAQPPLMPARPGMPMPGQMPPGQMDAQNFMRQRMMGRMTA